MSVIEYFLLASYLGLHMRVCRYASWAMSLWVNIGVRCVSEPAFFVLLCKSMRHDGGEGGQGGGFGGDGLWFNT